MTQFSKAHWSTDENSIRLEMDFSKVNKEKRLVSGYATLDNVDSQGDIVLADASKKAFSRARGNLREMHKKDSAVGRIVDFREDEFRAADGKKYRGIFVTAYVSKGAQDTWEKVLDKTLTGFSIGGDIIDFEEDWNKDAGKQVRIIKDYNLNELSLVDNPANQLANVFQIHKLADGSVTIEGMVANTKALNVFYCKTDQITQEKPDEKVECPVCNKSMTNIGWVEDGDDRDEKVNNIVTKFLSPTTVVENEGGVEVKKFTSLIKSEVGVVGPDEDESVATGHEAGDPDEVPTPAEPADEKAEEVNEVEIEKSESSEVVEEVLDEEEAISKQIDKLKDVIEKSLGDTRDETKAQVAALEKKIDDLSKSLDAKTSEFEQRFNELDTNLDTAKSRLSTFEKNLELINKSQAIRKSADLEESAETVQKSDTTWNGAFSVDNLLR